MDKRRSSHGAFDAEGFFRIGRKPCLGFPLAEIYTLVDVADAPDRWPPPMRENLSRPAIWDDGYFRGWAEALNGERFPPAAWVIIAFDASGDITACVEYLPVMRDGVMAGVTAADARGSRLWMCRAPAEIYRSAAAQSAAAKFALSPAGAIAP